MQSQIDVIKAHKGIKLSIAELQNVRSNAVKGIGRLFNKAVEMANGCGSTIQIISICQQQTNKENYRGESKDFYHNLLSYHISQLESRFRQISISAMSALHLMPNNLDSLTKEFQKDIFTFYGENYKKLISLSRKFHCGDPFEASQKNYHQLFTKLFKSLMKIPSLLYLRY